MNRIKSNPMEDLQCTSFILGEGQTFAHISIAKDADTMSKLNDVEKFTQFRIGLKERHLLKVPQAKILESVDLIFDV